MLSSVPFWMFSSFALLLGLCLGSFYNVCIHRYLNGTSIVFPASHCPKCGHSLAWWENIPLVSFIVLKGKCKNCQERISLRYPAVEGLSGIWALLLALKFGPSLPWLVFMLFGGLFLVMSFIDLESFILPDILTLPGSLLALPCAIFLLKMPWQESLLGALAGAGSFLLIQKTYKLVKGIEGLGTGDIKLMFLIGALLGWKSLPLVIFFSAVTGLLISLIYLARSFSQGLQTAIPFGPFLSLGAMLYILYGRELWLLYLG